MLHPLVILHSLIDHLEFHNSLVYFSRPCKVNKQLVFVNNHHLKIVDRLHHLIR